MGTSGSVPEDVEKEARVHTQLSGHKHIVTVIDTPKTNEYLYLVLDYCNAGSLFDRLQKENTNGSIRRFKSDVRKWFKQIAQALRYAHERNVCHKDLSLQNILLKETHDETIAMIA